MILFQDLGGVAGTSDPGRLSRPENLESARQRTLAIQVEDVAIRARHVERVREAVRRLTTNAAVVDRIILVAPESGVSIDARLPGDIAALGLQLDRIDGHLERRLARLTTPSELRPLLRSIIDHVVGALTLLQAHSGPKALVVIGPSFPYGVGSQSRPLYEEVMRATQRAGAPVFFFNTREVARPATAAASVALAGPSPGPPLPPPVSTSLSALSRSGLLEALAVDSGGSAAHDPEAWARTLDLIVGRMQAYTC